MGAHIETSTLYAERFKAAHAMAADWRDAANACLQTLGALPSATNLGFIYVTDGYAQEFPKIVEYFQAGTGVDQWVGTVGVGICASGQEYFDRPALAVLLAHFPGDGFRIFSSARSDIQEFVASHHEWYGANEARFGVVHGDPRNPKTAPFIAQLAHALNDGFLVGGITSSRGPHRQIAGTLTEGGVSGVLFSSSVPVATALTQGCTPLGPKHTISECRENIISRIDERPALDVFKEDIGEVLARDLTGASGYIFAGLPIKGSDTGDYLVRNIIGIDSQNKLLAVGEYLNNGDPIMFCRRDAQTARADLVRMVRDIKNRAGRAPKGAVYYSCLGRGQQMFGSDSEELKTIQAELGDVPLVGFFANGEISHNRLYGYTGVLTLFL